ncbi:hypothetical protein AWC38_SpisGene21535 [Stylophora pistillata]|uniref:SWIM-type domain-containing protein n=1 Tax=Stylophora pistillata TaxID=50429 RepID=A0A2B4RDI2_STYPI|nr:hypothetical protein AWC38_SpisGene21535 [Stylophora pistillata]
MVLSEVRCKTWFRKDFRFPDIYHYLVGKDGYDEDCLRSYKSLEGFRLFVDGHVEDLNYHDLSDDETGKKDGYCYFQFKVKPTERSKTEDGKDFYWGFIVLQYTGSIYSAYCACKGGADGACRHTAAALFDLEATIRRNDSETCTSVSCFWKLLLHCVALQFITKPPVQAVSEEELLDQITSADIDYEEIVEYAEVYSLKELADIFVAQNNFESLENPTYEHCSSFLEFLHHFEFATEVIFQKTLSQSTSNSEFWFSQRAGRIAASNFYKVCDMKETTNSKNTAKLLMNYCPLSEDSTPYQLSWGHEKEVAAIKEYLKKHRTKHRGLEVFRSGLIVDKQYPYLGASPDRIQVCKCCPKTLLEVKSIFSKRNLQPHVAEAHCLDVVAGKYYVKKETSWNYQMQGQLALARLEQCNLIIYTLKGILVTC